MVSPRSTLNNLSVKTDSLPPGKAITPDASVADSVTVEYLFTIPLVIIFKFNVHDPDGIAVFNAGVFQRLYNAFIP